MKENVKDKKEKPGLTTEVRLYVEKRIELFSIEVAEKVSLLVAHSVQKLVGVLILAGAIFFLWFAVGFLISDLVGNHSLGFFLSSIPLFLFGFILSKHKSKKLTEKIQADIVGKVMENFETDNNSQERSDEES